MTAHALTVPALLHRIARDHGDHPYLITPDAAPDDRLTYADAERRSAHLARFLLWRGIGKGTRLGLYFPNGTQWVTWWLAASRVGALVIPLSTLYPPAELAKVLRLSDVSTLVAPRRVLGIDVPARLEGALDGLAGQRADRIALPAAPHLRAIVLTGAPADGPGWATAAPAGGISDRTLVSPDVLAAAEAEVSPADLAVMVHTSGSTADPKGVLHTHGTLTRQTATWPAAIRAVTGNPGPPKVLCAMPFFWIGGLLATTGALHDPVTVLVQPNLDPGVALDLVERERATGVIGWPAFTQRLRDHPTFADRDLSSAPLLRDGPLDIAMVNVPDGYPVHRTMSETAGGFAHTEMAIVDETGAPVPDGEVGELLVRGVGVMAGYNKRERVDTFDADGWYHTGDRVYRRTGDPRLFYVGRTGDMIKSSGANVSPLEVEAVVERFDDVTQCVVVGLDHPERGEEVCAVIVPAAPSTTPTAPPTAPADLTARTRAQLSAYKVPTRWFRAAADQIPTLPSGKLDRRTVRARLREGAFEAL